MSATNDASQSEDSANSLLDRSSGAASTKKRDAPSDTSEDDAASASDAAPDTSSASRDAPKRRRVEDPAPTSVPALEEIRQRLGAEPADLARPDEAVRLFSQRRGDSTCCYRTFMTLIFALAPQARRRPRRPLHLLERARRHAAPSKREGEHAGLEDADPIARLEAQGCEEQEVGLSRRLHVPSRVPFPSVNNA